MKLLFPAEQRSNVIVSLTKKGTDIKQGLIYAKYLLTLFSFRGNASVDELTDPVVAFIRSKQHTVSLSPADKNIGAVLPQSIGCALRIKISGQCKLSQKGKLASRNTTRASWPILNSRIMELPASHEIFSSHASREKCRLSKGERARRNRELLWRRGSKILPDFFPPDTENTKPCCHQTTLSLRSVYLLREYSFEAQTIAESWMMYFGIKTCDTP